MADGADLRSRWLGRTEQVDGLDGSADLWGLWLFGLPPVTATGAGTGQAPSGAGSGTETFTGTGAGTQAAPSGYGFDQVVITGEGAGTQVAATASGSGSALRISQADTGPARRFKPWVPPLHLLPEINPVAVDGSGAGSQAAASSTGSGFVSDDALVLDLLYAMAA